VPQKRFLGGYKELLSRSVANGVLQPAQVRGRRSSGGSGSRHRITRDGAHLHATVAVMPEADPVEVRLRPAGDLEDQHRPLRWARARTSTSVGKRRSDLLHKPRGIIGCSAPKERSQLQNKERRWRSWRASCWDGSWRKRPSSGEFNAPAGPGGAGVIAAKKISHLQRQDTAYDHRLHATFQPGAVLGGATRELIGACKNRRHQRQQDGEAWPLRQGSG